MSIDREGEPIDPAYAPLEEAGEGESEGFELAERELIEHTSHGDEHGTSRIAFDAPDEEAEDVGEVDGEADTAVLPD